MRGSSYIRELIEGLGGNGAYEIIEGIVEGVDEDNLTINVRIDEGIVIPDIRLRSVCDGGEMGLVTLPAMGSQVVFAQVRGEADYILISTSQLDRVVVEISDVILDVNNEGVIIRKGSVDIRGLLEDLCSLLKEFKVATPSGPSSSVLPDSILAINQFETKFKSLFYAE